MILGIYLLGVIIFFVIKCAEIYNLVELDGQEFEDKDLITAFISAIFWPIVLIVDIYERIKELIDNYFKIH